MFRVKFLFFLFGLLLIVPDSGSMEERSLLSRSTSCDLRSQDRSTDSSVRKVNAPVFDGDVLTSETAIFWFGRVTPDENSVDVRVGYNDDHLYVRVAAIDRRLWYDTSPSLGDLTFWDSVTLYVDLDGNVGDGIDASAYRFDAQLNGWGPRENYQAVYNGDGNGWVSTVADFTTVTGWDGNAPNDDENDFAWKIWNFIPFESLGLSGPPDAGTVWGFSVVLHDRDDSGGTPIADKMWPETMNPVQSATWSQLAFGMPVYNPPLSISQGVVTIRQGLDGATVTDGDVGGGRDCGHPAWSNPFSLWGELNYAGEESVNIQNLEDVGDWSCFSRYYVSFPLGSIPFGKTIVSATLTLYQWGNAGDGQDPQPSLIQVHTVDQDWDESTLTWNNSPMALENVAATWANVYPEWPGEPRKWDVSRSVAEAYAERIPLRLALYESDWAYHSGKYFRSSDTDEYYQEMRPTLTVAWGRVLADVDKTASLSCGNQGDEIAYSLEFLGTGNSLVLTDTLSIGSSSPGSVQLHGTIISPVYDSNHHYLTWQGAPPLGQEVTIRYSVTITTGDTVALENIVSLYEIGGDIATDVAVIIANPYHSYLPLVVRSD